jgi:flagellar basal body-associated protein FliL
MNRDESLKPSRKISKWYYIIAGIIIIVMVAVGAILWFINRQPAGTLPYPIAKSVAKQLGFDIYYPSQKLLPTGYALNRASFEITNQVLIYSVSYGVTHKIIFSDQAKPTNAQIQAFYARNLPLNTTLLTGAGLATIGAINLQTVVSVPTNTNAWIIATAPGNINQNDLSRVMKSIELAK